MPDVDADDLKREAQRPVTLARGEVWLLRVAAATGVVSMVSHGAAVVAWLFKHV